VASPTTGPSEQTILAPDGMVVSSITLSPAVEREVEEEEPATDEEAEEARRTSRGYPRGR
jgi:hypothetical protein